MRLVDDKSEELCAVLGLDPATEVGNLAYGQQKAVEIARALAAEPEVLLLDEPASGVANADLDSLRRSVAAASSSDTALVAIEHNIGFVREMFPRTVVMADGQNLADGPTEQVLEHSDVLAAYFGVKP